MKETYTIKPLEWEQKNGISYANELNFYYRIWKFESGYRWRVDIGPYDCKEGSSGSLDHAKQLAEADWQARILPSLVKVDTETPGAYPFRCDNCSHEPTPEAVIKHGGNCEKCGDSVTAFTIDTAEFIITNAAKLTT